MSSFLLNGGQINATYIYATKEIISLFFLIEGPGYVFFKNGGEHLCLALFWQGKHSNPIARSLTIQILQDFLHYVPMSTTSDTHQALCANMLYSSVYTSSACFTPLSNIRWVCF